MPQGSQPPIKDVNEFVQRLTDLYARAFAGMGRDSTYQVFVKFFVRRVLKHLESKAGGPVEDEDERASMIEHLEEEIGNAVDEFESTYFDEEDGVA